MDYRTKSISREELRMLAKLIRKIFKCRNKFYFDVIKAFELLPHIFPNVITVIVPDDDSDLLEAPATTIPDMKGNYLIKISESVYDGAFKYDTGGYRNHILHEMCHVILFSLGYYPRLDRAFKNYELKNYESIEWQAKALAGEILIPYDKTIRLSIKTIKKRCKVSDEAAAYRYNLNKKKVQ